MTITKLQHYVDEHIPIVKANGFTILEAGLDRVSVGGAWSTTSTTPTRPLEAACRRRSFLPLGRGYAHGPTRLIRRP